MIGSACLCATFQTPFSRRKMVVTRTATAKRWNIFTKTGHDGTVSVELYTSPK